MKGCIDYSLGDYDSAIKHYENCDSSLKHFGLALTYQMTNRTVDDIEQQFKLALENCRSASLYSKIMLHHRYLYSHDESQSNKEHSKTSCVNPFFTQIYLIDDSVDNKLVDGLKDKEKKPTTNKNIIRHYTSTNKISFDSLVELIMSCNPKNEIAFFTGSGVSVASGLPTRQNLWNSFFKRNAVSITGIRNNPQYIWKVIKEFYKIPHELGQDDVYPNDAHKGIASLMKKFNSRLLVTQNVDELHQRALEEVGHAANVIELHGSMSRLFCPLCGSTNIAITNDCRTESVGKAFDVHKDLRTSVPICVSCSYNGYYSTAIPDVVLFGESDKRENHTDAVEGLLNSNAIITSGTAFDVMPASTMLTYINNLIPIIDINPDKPKDGFVNYWYEGSAEETFKKLDEAIDI